jgi:hypothetical protein
VGTLEFKDDVRSPNISPRESLGLWHGYDIMKIDAFSQLVVYMIWSLLEFGRGLILSSDEVMVRMFMRVHDSCTILSYIFYLELDSDSSLE